jgi:Flp pilus assembly protein TadG
MRILLRLAKDPHATVAAEFALILPLLVLFFLGIIDVGRMMWTWNRAEKAAQMGVRYAAVTDMADAGMAGYDFYDEGIARGSTIPDTAFTDAVCTSTGCTCNGGAICDAASFSQTAFDNTVARMQAIMPEIQPENVTLRYSYSGLGYSGDPYGPDINPLITVELSGVTFQPTLGYVLGTSMTLPSFASTLSMEDGRWAISN